MTTVRIRVERPIRTDDTYVFPYRVTDTTPGRRLVARLAGLRGVELRLGFQAVNFSIRHSPLWDSFCPLWFLTRIGGPVFGHGIERCEIRFDYPVLDRVARFFEGRAANLGYEAVVTGRTYDDTFDLPTSGRQIPFGGGKDSRTILGLLRELGESPTVSTAGRANWPPDLPGAIHHEPVNGALTERLMPILMSGAAHVYLGGNLNGVAWHSPWHRYYDWASPEAQGGLAGLLRSLGVAISFHCPLGVLPANLTQKVLFDRYPDLFAHQRSVAPNARKEKQLQIALLRLYHGIPIGDGCSDEVFRFCLRQFHTARLANPDDWGPHHCRMVFQREMMALVYRLRDHPLLSEVRDAVPATWDASWIDGVHAYVDRRVDPSILEIFREYAPEYVPPPGAFAVPLPPERTAAG